MRTLNVRLYRNLEGGVLLVKPLFHYNWQIRDEWFQCLELVPNSELMKERNTGVGSIFKTLFHIIDVEYSWIRALQNKTDLSFDMIDCQAKCDNSSIIAS